MFAETAPIETTVEDLARELLYRFLAAVAGGPFAPGWDDARDEASREAVLVAAEVLSDGAPDLDGWGPLVRCLGGPPEALRDDYDRVFGLIAPKECPPYETEYYPTAETFARSQQMADIAGFYRAFGVEPTLASPERPDHLALELEFLALLLMKRRLAIAEGGAHPEASERATVCDEALRGFVRDHLAWWVPSFAAGLARRSEGIGYPAALARVLSAWVPTECRRLGIDAILRPARPELIETAEEQGGCASCPLHV